jgi:VWFA-related protein
MKIALFILSAAMMSVTIPARQDEPPPVPASPPPAAAAPGEEAPVIQANVRMVHILATVRDKDGRPVKDLTAGDFVLEEEGRPQKIEYFSRSDSLPLSLGLLVDTSRSQRRLIDDEKDASRLFFEKVLRPETDRAFLLRFDFEAVLMKGLTNARDSLETALQRLRVGSPPPGTRGGTVLYDAVYLAADEVLTKPTGQKAMVVITDGVDFGSIVSLDNAIEMAQRSESAVYCICYADPEAYADRGGHGGGGYGGGRGPGGISIGIPFPIPIPGGPSGGPTGGPGRGPGRGPGGRPSPADGKQTLQELASETGGAMFEITHGKDLAEIYRQIEEELRNQYVIGYTPSQESGDLEFRHIKLESRRPDLTVRCRSGYYPRVKG